MQEKRNFPSVGAYRPLLSLLYSVSGLLKTMHTYTHTCVPIVHGYYFFFSNGIIKLNILQLALLASNMDILCLYLHLCLRF